jgi:hypothetical protein
LQVRLFTQFRLLFGIHLNSGKKYYPTLFKISLYQRSSDIAAWKLLSLPI